MFEALMKILGAIGGSIKDAPALIVAVGNRMDKKHREQAVRDLRILHFSPRYRTLLAEAATVDYAANPQTLRKLEDLLDETAQPVAEAIDRLIEFGESYADLPYEDFSNIMMFLDGKSDLRGHISRQLRKLREESSTEGSHLSADELAAIEERILELNKSIGQAHEAIRLLANSK